MGPRVTRRSLSTALCLGAHRRPAEDPDGAGLRAGGSTAMTCRAARIAAKLGLACFAASALSIAIGGHALAGDRPLAGGTSHDESAKAGEALTYRIALGAGQAAEVSLRQRDATALEFRWS